MYFSISSLSLVVYFVVEASAQLQALSLGNQLAAKQPLLAAARYSRKVISPSLAASSMRQARPVRVSVAAANSKLDTSSLLLSSKQVKLEQSRLLMKPELAAIPSATSYYEKTVQDLIEAHKIWTSKEETLDKALLELEQHKLNLKSAQDLPATLEQAQVVGKKIKAAKAEVKAWIVNSGNWPPNLQQFHISRSRSDLKALEEEVNDVVTSIKRAKMYAALHKSLEDELGHIKLIARLEKTIEFDLKPDAKNARHEFLLAKNAFDQVGGLHDPVTTS